MSGRLALYVENDAMFNVSIFYVVVKGQLCMEYEWELIVSGQLQYAFE